jgi:hypothetical protein
MKRIGRIRCGAIRSSTSRSVSASRTSRSAPVLEIAQAAVDELGRGRRRARAEVVLLEQQHAQAPAGGVARDAGAVDAAADDGEIVVGHIAVRHGAATCSGDSVELENARPARRAQACVIVSDRASAFWDGDDMRKLLPLLAILAVADTSSAIAQDSVAQFYKGRQITVVVGSSPGGGYDIYARLMARHMGKYIPGNPSMLVSNMPGAGSNTAVAHVYNVAAKDGTFIAAPQNSAVMDALFDAVLGTNRRLRHDATKLIQLGSATTDHYVCIGRSDARSRHSSRL